MDEELSRFINCAKLRGLSPSVAALVQAAERRGIPWMGLGKRNLIQLGQGRHQKLIYGTITSQTSRAAITLSADKVKTNRLLAVLHLPVPRQQVVYTAEEATEAVENIGYPVVLKPRYGCHGDGVCIRPPTAAAVRAAFQRAHGRNKAVIVEEFIPGFDYRMLVVNHDVVAAAQRFPGHVVGDGSRTIEQLVGKINEDPARSEGHDNILTRLRIDGEATRLLKLRNCTRDTVPARGDVVYLREAANLSTGGTATDVTDIVHRDNRSLAIKAVEAVGLDIGGVDFVSPDIAKSQVVVGGAICEVNAAPGLRMHLAPSRGMSRDVATPIIDMLFPPGTCNSIPIVSIVRAPGTAKVSYMLAQILRSAGCVVGLSTADGIFLDGQPLHARGTDLRNSWRVVLEQPTVEVAVFDVPSEHPAPSAYCRPDVTAYLAAPTDQAATHDITTMSRDAHLPPAGSKITVLNADDPDCLKISTGCARDRLYHVTMNKAHAGVNKHILLGGAAVVLDDRTKGFRLYDGAREYSPISTHSTRILSKKSAREDVQSVMFAAATAHALGVDVESIAAALHTL
jgi:cyanophycin synthetase